MTTNYIPYDRKLLDILFYARCLHKKRFTGKTDEEWLDFLKYMIEENKDLKIIENWPKDFLNDNLIKSLKMKSKFNL